MSQLVVDATNALLGRLASYVAKETLKGHEVIVVNCKEAVVSGNPRSVIEEYGISRKRGGHSLNGPFFPRSPERIVKRTIRGMLPHLQERGKTALGRVKCYNETPRELADAKKIKPIKEKNIKTISLRELSTKL